MTKNEIMKADVEEKITELCDAGKIITKYVRAADKEYGFTILITWHYSSELDDLNLQAMNLGQLFMDWIDEQNRMKNFPNFGENCQVKRIENLQNMPNLATVDWESGIAQYQIPCRVIYFEKER